MWEMEAHAVHVNNEMNIKITAYMVYCHQEESNHITLKVSILSCRSGGICRYDESSQVQDISG